MTRNPCLICLAATLALALLPAAAHAENEVLHFRGHIAEASFQTPEPGGCITTWTDVFLFEDSAQGPPESQAETSTFLSVFLVRFDQCQDLFLGEISGFATLPPDAYSFGGGLHSARLSTTLEAFDFTAGAMVPVTIDLVWEGVGEAVHTSSGGRFSSPHLRMRTRFRGTRREAVATGSVLVRTVNMTPAPSVEASLGSNQSGSVTLFR